MVFFHSGPIPPSVLCDFSSPPDTASLHRFYSSFPARPRMLLLSTRRWERWPNDGIPRRTGWVSLCAGLMAHTWLHG